MTIWTCFLTLMDDYGDLMVAYAGALRESVLDWVERLNWAQDVRLCLVLRAYDTFTGRTP